MKPQVPSLTLYTNISVSSSLWSQHWGGEVRRIKSSRSPWTRVFEACLAYMSPCLNKQNVLSIFRLLQERINSAFRWRHAIASCLGYSSLLERWLRTLAVTKRYWHRPSPWSLTHMPWLLLLLFSVLFQVAAGVYSASLGGFISNH